MDVVREALRDLIQFYQKDTENRLYRFCRSSNRISGKIHQLRWELIRKLSQKVEFYLKSIKITWQCVNYEITSRYKKVICRNWRKCWQELGSKKIIQRIWGYTVGILQEKSQEWINRQQMRHLMNLNEEKLNADQIRFITIDR